jgi:hypothetical protein
MQYSAILACVFLFGCESLHWQQRSDLVDWRPEVIKIGYVDQKRLNDECVPTPGYMLWGCALPAPNAKPPMCWIWISDSLRGANLKETMWEEIWQHCFKGLTHG